MALQSEKLSDFSVLKADHMAYGRMNEGQATSFMQAELDILQKVALGDHASFKELYTLYAENVYNTALGFVQNVEDAEEISQEVFVRVFRNAGKFQGNSKLSTWIYRITVKIFMLPPKIFAYLEILRIIGSPILVDQFESHNFSWTISKFYQAFRRLRSIIRWI